MVKSFLVETYAPATTLVTDIEALVRHASAGTAVRYARSIFVPEDEVCFHLFEAAPSSNPWRNPSLGGHRGAAHHGGEGMTRRAATRAATSPPEGQVT